MRTVNIKMGKKSKTRKFFIDFYHCETRCSHFGGFNSYIEHGRVVYKLYSSSSSSINSRDLSFISVVLCDVDFCCVLFDILSSC